LCFISIRYYFHRHMNIAQLYNVFSIYFKTFGCKKYHFFDFRVSCRSAAQRMAGNFRVINQTTTKNHWKTIQKSMSNFTICELLKHFAFETTQSVNDQWTLSSRSSCIYTHCTRHVDTVRRRYATPSTTGTTHNIA